MSDFDVEPIPGLPARPPGGETILWQGAPDWRALALRALHVRKVFVWFGVIALWRVVSAVHDHALTPNVGTAVSFLALLSLVAAAMLCAFAWAVARTTVYTITNRRVVMRFGVALPMTVNLPFSKINGAGLRLDTDGTGDIPLVLAANNGLSYMVLWPHVRPWRARRPEPMLRCIPEARSVAATLAQAFSECQPARVTLDGMSVRPETDRPALAPAG